MGNCFSSFDNTKLPNENAEVSSDSGYSSTKGSQSGKSDSNYSTSQTEKQDVEKVKLLLVGAGEAGKSTFYKLMINQTNIYDSERERMMFISSIRDNIIEALKTIILTSKKLGKFTDSDGIEYDTRISPDLDDEVNFIFSLTPQNIPTNPVSQIKKIIKDKGFSILLNKLRHLYQMPDGTDYFFDHLDEIFEDDYIPDIQDILYCRDRTTGVTHQELQYNYNGKKYIIDIYDVGGQRTERKAWKNIFNGVSIIIFVMPLSEYDTTCIEDKKTNRSVESLTVLHLLDKAPNFKKTPFMLLLTKKDQLKNKLETGRKFKINAVTNKDNNRFVAFEDYEGDGSYESVEEYLVNAAKKQMSESRKKVVSTKNLLGKSVDFKIELDTLLKYYEENKKEN